MQEPLFSPTITNKFYSPRAVMVGTLLGGPLAAGYLLAANYRSMGREDLVPITWVFTVVSFIAIIALAWFMPASVPGFLFSLLCAGLAQLVTMQLQGKQIQLHTESGGSLHKAWRGAVVGIIVSAILILIILAAFLALDVPVL